MIDLKNISYVGNKECKEHPLSIEYELLWYSMFPILPFRDKRELWCTHGGGSHLLKTL